MLWRYIFTKIVQDQTNQLFLSNYLFHETVLYDLKSQKRKGECCRMHFYAVFYSFHKRSLSNYVYKVQSLTFLKESPTENLPSHLYLNVLHYYLRWRKSCFHLVSDLKAPKLVQTAASAPQTASPTSPSRSWATLDSCIAQGETLSS